MSHGPTVRSQKSDKSEGNWEKRQSARKKEEAVKKLERSVFWGWLDLEREKRLLIALVGD